MNLNNYQPFWPFDEVRAREFNRPFGFNGRLQRPAARPAMHGRVPPVDIKEEADRFVLFVDVPGVDPQDIEITFEKGVLSIKGDRAAPERAELNRYSRLERPKHSFERRFRLPETVNPDAISARGEHGVLQVTIGKAPATTARKITVE